MYRLEFYLTLEGQKPDIQKRKTTDLCEAEILTFRKRAPQMGHLPRKKKHRSLCGGYSTL